jgi:DNA-binding MarR family transcriptional regulator
VSIDVQLLQELKQTRPFRSAAEELAVALLLTTERLRRFLTKIFEDHGVTPQQYNVLRILRGSHPEPLPTLEIAARLVEAAPGITALIDRLEGKGLVSRTRSPEDRRQVLVEITPAGFRLLEKVDPVLLEKLDAVFARFSSGELETIALGLQRVRNVLFELRQLETATSIFHREPTAEKGAC